MAHKRAAMGGRSLRLECLCLVFAGGPTTMAQCRVFRLLIKGSTRDHWTHAEWDWATGGKSETEIWWNVKQTCVQTMMSVTEKVAVIVKTCRLAHVDWPQHSNKGLSLHFFSYLDGTKPPLQHRSAVLQKVCGDKRSAVSFSMPHELHVANNGKMLQ